MPQFMDISGGRIRPFEDFDPATVPPDAYAAAMEMRAGEWHRAMLLGSRAQVASAHELARRPVSMLQSTGGFLVFISSRQRHDRIVLGHAIYGRDDFDLPGTALRYASGVMPYSPEDLPASESAAAVMIRGVRLVAGVVTIEDPEVPDSAFDALYVPKVWEDLTPPEGMSAEEYAVSLAAGHIILGMTEAGYDLN